VVLALRRRGLARTVRVRLLDLMIAVAVAPPASDATGRATGPFAFSVPCREVG
jgi:hypothetical protein